MTPLEILAAASDGCPAPRIPVFCNLLMRHLKGIRILPKYGGIRIKRNRRKVALKRIGLHEGRERSKEQLARRKQVNQLIE